jgi:hypothetical protein
MRGVRNRNVLACMGGTLFFLAGLMKPCLAESTANEPEDYTGPFTTQALYTMCSEGNPVSREKCNLYLQGLVYGVQVERRMQEHNMPFCLPDMTAETARLRLLDFINGVTEGNPSNNKDDGNWIAFMAVAAGHQCKNKP